MQTQTNLLSSHTTEAPSSQHVIIINPTDVIKVEFDGVIHNVDILDKLPYSELHKMYTQLATNNASVKEFIKIVRRVDRDSLIVLIRLIQSGLVGDGKLLGLLNREASNRGFEGCIPICAAIITFIFVGLFSFSMGILLASTT